MAETPEKPKKKRASSSEKAGVEKAPKPAVAKSAKAPKAGKPAKVEAVEAAAVVEAAQPVVAAVRPAPSHDEIRRRAYELWLANRGSATENWLEAERQLRA
jgi:hypothetical protein